MNISSIGSAFAYPMTVSAKQASGTGSTGFEVETTGETSGSTKAAPADKIAAVFAKYDLSNISPREIDQMGAELREAGFQDHEFLLTMETHGERFQSFGAKALNDAGIVAEPPDPNRAVDLFARVDLQLTQSRRFGDPTASLQKFMDAMHYYEGQGAASTIAAETIVTAKAAG